jgi:hypothetical protein
MRRCVLLVPAAFLVLVGGNPVQAADSGKPSVQTMPPAVVKTVPESGDTKVDPATSEIKVTFSKKMSGGMSWSQISNDTFPQTTGKPHYDADGKTCVMPVKLEPGKTYVIWLNSAKFTNFKDTTGKSAVPYLLVFETKGE